MLSNNGFCYAACEVCVTILVLMVNSTQFQILRSSMPVLMHSLCMYEHPPLIDVQYYRTLDVIIIRPPSFFYTRLIQLRFLIPIKAHLYLLHISYVIKLHLTPPPPQ